MGKPASGEISRKNVGSVERRGGPGKSKQTGGSVMEQLELLKKGAVKKNRSYVLSRGQKESPKEGARLD